MSKKLIVIWLCCLDYSLFWEDFILWCFVSIYWGSMLIECVKPYRKESEILKLSPSTKIAAAEGWQIYHHKKKNTRSSHSCYGWKWHLTLWQNILNFVKIKKFWKLVICFCYFWKKKKFVRRGPWGPIFLLRLDWKIVIFWGFSKMFFRSTGFELTLLILIEFPNTFHWKQAKNQSWCGLGSKFGPK